MPKLTLQHLNQTLENRRQLQNQPLNSEETMKEIIKLAKTACEKYTNGVKSEDSYYDFFRRIGSTRKEQVNELQSYLNNYAKNEQDKVKKIIDTFCKLKRKYRTNNGCFNSYFLKQLTIYPIKYLLQVVSCRYIHAEKINADNNIGETLTLLNFPDELCLHFTRTQKFRQDDTPPNYVCDLIKINTDTNNTFGDFGVEELKGILSAGTQSFNSSDFGEFIKKYNEFIDNSNNCRTDFIAQDKELLSSSESSLIQMNEI